jgi:hypothetical protein
VEELNMKRLIILALAVALVPVAGAQQLYKYVDKDGKTVYSDQPPPDVDSKQLRVSTGSASAPQKSAVERMKEGDKARKDVADKGTKAGDEAEKQAQAEQRCQAARSNLQIYTDGGRIQRINAQGERELMNDEELEAATVRARRDVEEACKK